MQFLYSIERIDHEFGVMKGEQSRLQGGDAAAQAAGAARGCAGAGGG